MRCTVRGPKIAEPDLAIRGVVMSENTDMQRSWNSARRPDADVDLLLRSISHVEHLLDRLEYGAAVRAEVVADGEQLHTDAMSAAATTPDELRLAAQREAEAIKRDARNWANEHCAIAEAAARQRLDAAERDAEQIRQTAREMAQAQACQHIENEIRTAVAEAVSDVDAARDLAHDTLSVAVASLANALQRVQHLATALEADAAPPTGAALVIRPRHGHHPDSGGDARDDTDVLGGVHREVSAAGGTRNFGGVPKASRPIGTRFRTARP